MSGKRLFSSHPHLTLDDRIVIQEFLDQGTRLRDLAGQIKEHPSSFVKEIKRSRSRRFPSHFNEPAKNNCAHKKTCRKRSVCKPGCHLHCSAYSKCNSVCPDFVRDEYQMPLRFPYVCNTCPTKNGCRKTKFFYSATVADALSHDLRKSPRLGISLSEQQLLDLDLLLTPLIQKGQPINHIFATQKEKIPCSKRTLYRYIDLGYLAARNIDLRRKVSYKPRKSRHKKAPGPAYRKNRTYSDFLIHAGYHPDLQIVEMDTVIGRISDKVLLTLLFRDSDILLIFLLQNNSQSAVLEVFNFLENTMGIGLFKAFFPIILTDYAEFGITPTTVPNSRTLKSLRILPTVAHAAASSIATPWLPGRKAVSRRVTSTSAMSCLRAPLLTAFPRMMWICS